VVEWTGGSADLRGLFSLAFSSLYQYHPIPIVTKYNNDNKGLHWIVLSSRGDRSG